MDKELVKKWVAALRSGEYKQGGGYLFDISGGGYCCLGVAASLFYNIPGSRELLHAANSHFLINDLELRERLSLDKRVVNSEVYQTRCELSGKLVHMNDQEKRTFPEIADYIEKELLSDDTTTGQ